MSIKAYINTQNITDSPRELSIRAVRSVYLYCRDWSDDSLSHQQKLQSLEAGQVLCDALVIHLNEDLHNEIQETLIKIFSKTSFDLFQCQTNPKYSLIENERALLHLLKILECNT